MWGPLLAGLSRLIGSRVGQWFLAALAALGLSYVATEFAVDPMLDWVKGAIATGPAQWVSWAGFLNIDRYFTITLSAYAVAASAGALRLRKKKGA
ncbi:DUF2523 family protein [Xanthomonas euvesicatoria]|uniref:DUF2523 family protein n=1 Tax=Xanthomonas euvesicatoria TaxID=456327 RepID=UPI00062D097F|nr:DUF2523 family protein [Xanthomonas euvesicatoria]APO90443.1 hypothetical protein BJD11_10630 [Xanthomonas euvesicatoria]KLB35673.1 hypothetical protein XEUV206_23395 [Xanthomonas euvesicatoria]MCC8582202.1 DUF2523 domain-containing protein [Xanthomonas euvesicatoria pv. euvesicatoria]MCC8593924.1 DUF2523 domain-containing protein [Xanthomonas euvesicatoria pv. euvesicatoria]